MSPRRTLLFDLDGTIVDSAAPIAAALNLLAQHRGGEPVSETKVRGLVSMGAAVLVREALGRSAWNDDGDVAAFREILRTIPTDTGWIYPGAYAAIEDLSSLGHKLAIVTNKPESLSRSLLDELGLLEFFQAVVGGDTLTSSKPDPEPLLHAVRLTGGSLASAILVGDSAVDAMAARAAGLPFILFKGGYGAQQCSPEDVYCHFSDFAALPGLISSDASDIGCKSKRV